MPRNLIICTVLAALLPLARPAVAAPVPGVIKGADAVNLRRGPGPETAAIVALHRGARVQVEERVGQWALIVLESGERGYVNAAFVELAPGATIPVAPPTAGAGETLLATPEATATGAAAPAPPAIDRELAALRERLASLEASMQHPAAGDTAHSAAHEDVAPAPPAVPTMVEPPATLDVGPSLALAGVGFLIGFLFGTLYGQRQERNRRTRVRF